MRGTREAKYFLGHFYDKSGLKMRFLEMLAADQSHAIYIYIYVWTRNLLLARKMIKNALGLRKLAFLDPPPKRIEFYPYFGCWYID